MSLTVIGSHKCLLHDMGDGHPERPSRLGAINDQLIASGLDMVVRQKDATPASRDELYLAHDRHYVDAIYKKAESDEPQWLDGDTRLAPGTLEAALYSAGSARDAVDIVMADDNQQVFCAVRPPGHHAERDKAMGFCIFNNIAIAAYYAIQHYGLQRIAIVDFDVHHGNGTEHICAGDERIQFYSSFQHPFYPHSGDGDTASNIHNVPLEAGCSGQVFRESITPWLEDIDRFAPQLILISAGFDSHSEDEMGQLRLQEADYAWISSELKQLADHHCHGRVVSALEGGYALSALGRSVVSHLKALIG